MDASARIEISSADANQEHVLNHRGVDSNHDAEAEGKAETETENENENEIAQEEQVRGVLRVISSTGNFWHNWDKLKSMLSFQLKRVLSEYPEAKMKTDQQKSSLGETYQVLVDRLDEELHTFIEGPPFTLQRICEILLAARGIYPNLPKLALALEKNLLVTSTLTVCTNPNSHVTLTPELEKASAEDQPHSNAIQNEEEPVVGERDEIMTEVEGAAIEGMTIDMGAFQEMVGSLGSNYTIAKTS